MVGWLVWTFYSKTRYNLNYSHHLVLNFFPSLALALPGLSFCGNGCDCVVQGPWYVTPPSPTGKVHTFKPNFSFDLVRFQYFEAKKMTKQQIAIFMEERKWSYRGERT